MTNIAISGLSAGTPVSADLFPFVKVSDHSTFPAGPGGSDQKVTTANLAAALSSVGSYMTIVPVSGDSTGATDTNAINAVVQAGKTAWLGPGTYYITNILLDSYGSIIGSGAATILLVVSGTTGYAIALLHPATTAQITLQGFRLNCNQVCGGVQLDNTGFAPISSFVPYDPLHKCSDVFVLGANGDAWHLDNNARGLQFYNCRQYFASGYGFYMGPGAGASGAGCTDSTFTACLTGPSGNHGYLVAAGSSDNMFANCKAFYSGYNEATASWGTTECGFEIQGDWNTFASCNAQQAALHGFDLQSCDSTSVNGCDSDTNSAGTTGGVGINVNAATNCTVIGNVGSNNAGLSPGSQTFGYQVGGNCTGTLLYGNALYGTSGTFNYVAGGFGFQLIDEGTFGIWSAAIAQMPSPTWSTYGTTQALSSSSTIVNGVPSTGSNFAIHPVSSTAAVTGIILAVPPNGDGTMIMVVNTTAFSITFAASGTSHVQTGTNEIIPAFGARIYLYDGSSSLWNPVTQGLGCATATLASNFTSGTGTAQQNVTGLSASLGVGTWNIRGWFPYVGAGTIGSTQKFAFTFGGTAAANSYIAWTNKAAAYAAPTVSSTVTTAITTATITSTVYVMEFIATIVVTAAGTLQLTVQSTTSGDEVTIEAGAFLEVTQVA